MSQGYPGQGGQQQPAGRGWGWAANDSGYAEEPEAGWAPAGEAAGAGGPWPPYPHPQHPGAGYQPGAFSPGGYPPHGYPGAAYPHPQSPGAAYPPGAYPPYGYPGPGYPPGPYPGGPMHGHGRPGFSPGGAAWYQPPGPPPKRRPAGAVAAVIVLILLIAGIGLFAAVSSEESTTTTAAGRPLEAGDADRLFYAAEDSVVEITGRACRYNVSGSGFFAEGNLVVTNAHVVAGMDAPTVHTSDRGEHPASVLLFDAAEDLAILEVNGASAPPLRLDAAEPPRGEGIVALGFPEGGPYTGTAGEVRVVDKVDAEDIYGNPAGQRRQIVLSIELKHGNSGGPVVNRDGQVIGVASAGNLVFARSGYAVPSKSVADRLARVSGGKKVSGAGRCLPEEM